MFNRKTVFIILRFSSTRDVFDYPKHLPIPQKGDIVIYNEHLGIVENIRHCTRGTVTNISIECGSRHRE